MATFSLHLLFFLFSFIIHLFIYEESSVKKYILSKSKVLKSVWFTWSWLPCGIIAIRPYRQMHLHNLDYHENLRPGSLSASDFTLTASSSQNQVSGRFYHTWFLQKGKPSSILLRHKHPHVQPSWAFWLISTDLTQLAFNFSIQENVPKEQTIRPWKISIPNASMKWESSNILLDLCVPPLVHSLMFELVSEKGTGQEG